MAAKKVLITTGAALALYALTKKKSQAPQQEPIATNQGATSTGQNTPVLSIGQMPGSPDYENWRRPEWSQLYKNIYQSNGPVQANQQIWDLWTNERNQRKDNINSMQQLIFDLATFAPAAEVGTTGQVQTIKADDVPVYQTWSNWWNYVPTWDCEMWQVWFDLNRQKYGEQTAKNKFVSAWNNPDNFSYTFTAAGNECGIDCDFVNYFRLKGIDVSYTGVETICNLVSVPSNLIDATAAASQAANKTVNTVGQLLPLATVVVLGAFVYRQVKIAKDEE